MERAQGGKSPPVGRAARSDRQPVLVLQPTAESRKCRALACSGLYPWPPEQPLQPTQHASVRFSITSALPAASGLPNSCKSKSIARIYGRTGRRTRPSPKPHKHSNGLSTPPPPRRSRTDSPGHTALNLFTGAFRFWQLAFLTRRYHLRTCMRRALWYRNLWFH